MSSQQLGAESMITPEFDEQTIVTVGREIQKPQVRALYLSQVCEDPELRLWLEKQLGAQRQWQFGLSILFLMMLFAAILSAFLGIAVNRWLRIGISDNTAIQDRLRAE